MNELHQREYKNTGLWLMDSECANFIQNHFLTELFLDSTSLKSTRTCVHWLKRAVLLMTWMDCEKWWIKNKRRLLNLQKDKSFDFFYTLLRLLCILEIALHKFSNSSNFLHKKLIITKTQPARLMPSNLCNYMHLNFARYHKCTLKAFNNEKNQKSVQRIKKIEVNIEGT